MKPLIHSVLLVPWEREIMPNFQQLLESIRKTVSEVDVENAQALQRRGAIFVDVRDNSERSTGMITDAIGIGRDFLEMKIGDYVCSSHDPVVAYCASGTRSLLAAKAILDLGYQNVYSLAGGMAAWKAAGKKLVYPEAIDPDFESRYQKHFLLQEVGIAGQKKLAKAKVLIVGAGGLSSPSLAYLTAAGVGTIGVVDNDWIERSNLQRQIIHRDHEVGLPKVTSAARFARELNPKTKLNQYNTRLCPENIDEICRPYDLIVDGTDNFSSRFLINDTCVKFKKPHIHGAIYRFSGEVTVFSSHSSVHAPCYRCLFPEPPPPELAPSCAEAGVLGVLPGIIGALQAHEAIKIILGISDTLVGRLLQFNGLKSAFKEIKISKDLQCSVCKIDNHY